ncbi:c-type cytochrome [Bradyrhizobium sp. USDA 4473]
MPTTASSHSQPNRRNERANARNLRRWALGAAALGVASLLGFAAFAWRPAIPEIATPPSSSFSAGVVSRGAMLSSAGYCATCHSVQGGQPFAGGYAMKSPFGTLYSTNITPDRETGIGAWSKEAFRRAMHEGVARDGSHLFPGFPYDHFTKVSDGDVDAIYAFLMTQPAVRAPARPNELLFPLGIRALQAGWKLLFFRSGRFEPSPDHDAKWNRGAYIAEALSHCSACHTPRNPLGAERSGSARYTGAAVDGWFAPALTAANPSPLSWTADELRAYLFEGLSRFHGTPSGPMSPAAHGLAALSPDDREALVTYVASIGGGASRSRVDAAAVDQALQVDATSAGRQIDPDAGLYAAACASCHYNGSAGVNASRPDLALNSAVHLADPANLIRVILFGIGASEGANGLVMPAFGSGFSNAEVARIAAYLRRTRTNQPTWPVLEKTVGEIRAQGKGEG